MIHEYTSEVLALSPVACMHDAYDGDRQTNWLLALHLAFLPPFFNIYIFCPLRLFLDHVIVLVAHLIRADMNTT